MMRSQLMALLAQGGQRGGGERWPDSGFMLTVSAYTLPEPRTELASLSLAGGFLTTEPLREAP